jgi:hypothetical protein
VNDHPLSLGLRGCIDLSQVSTPTPPGVEYIRQFVTAIRPVLEAVYSARCALLVSSEPLLWRARLIETMTSGSRVCFRAFTNKAAALAWLDADQSEHRALVGPA